MRSWPANPSLAGASKHDVAAADVMSRYLSRTELSRCLRTTWLPISASLGSDPPAFDGLAALLAAAVRAVPDRPSWAKDLQPVE